MLRFDIAPICANAYRFQAAMSFAIAAAYLFTRVPQFRAKNRGFLPRPLNGIKNLGLETEKPL